MSEFMGFNALVRFDGGVIRIIRRESTPEQLAECEKVSPKVRVLDIEAREHKLFEVYSHLALIVDVNETKFKVQSANDNRPNMVLIDKSAQWKAAQPVIAEIEAALASGQEIFYMSLDPSELPAPQLAKHTAAPEWEELASEIRNTLLGTNKDSYSFFISSIRAPEFPEGLGFQGLFPKPNKAYLELSNSENPPFNSEVLIALEKAGWAGPSYTTPNFSITVNWSVDEADNVANFLANTLQWCLFLDAATVRISHDITQDS